MAKKVVKVKKAATPEAEPVEVELPEGQHVNYVMPDGVIVPAVLVDVGGPAPHLVAYPDGAEPLSLSMTQYIDGAQAPTFSAEQQPNTWHHLAEGA